VTTLDWIIVVFTLGLAMYGYAQGFVVGALTLLGFAAGAFIGTRVAPALLPGGSRSPYGPLFGLIGALLGGALLAGTLEGVGLRVRGLMRLPGLTLIDGLAGAALTACVALGMAWVAGAVALQTPGATALRADVQRSLLLGKLNTLLPPSGAILNALARFDPSPHVTGPSAGGVAAPAPGIARAPAVRAATTSTVRMLGTACGLGIEGSGWIAAPQTVVTNAHVVAGESDTVVQSQGVGPQLRATVIAFDPINDVAVLRVPGLSGTPLRLGPDPRSGTAAAIIGYPEDGPLSVRPGRVGATEQAISQDAYGRGPVRREITSMRGAVRSGNSGGPMVDAAGGVVTTVFAATVGSVPAGGYGVPNDRVRSALASASGPVGTGPCAG